MAFERRQFLTTKNLSDNGLLGKDREILIDKTNKRVGYCDENGTLESMANVNELPDLSGYATQSFVTNLTGDLDNLTTTDKSNLVAAINEAAQSGGGSGDSLIAVPTYDLSWTNTGSVYEAVIDPTAYGITSDYHKYAIALWCEIDCKATSCTALATANGWTITIADSQANPSGQQYGYLLIHKTNRQVIPQGGSNLPLLQCTVSGGGSTSTWTTKIIPVTFTNATQAQGGSWVDSGSGMYTLTFGTSNGMPSIPTQADAEKVVGYWEDNFVISGNMSFPSMLNVGTLLDTKLTIANSYNSSTGLYDLTATIYANSLPQSATTGKLNLILLNGANQ